MHAVPVTETAAANSLNTLMRTVGRRSVSTIVVTVLTNVTLTQGGQVAPALSAYLIVFVIAGAAAVVAAGLGPADPGPAAGPRADAGRRRCPGANVTDAGRIAILRAARRAFALQPYNVVTLRGIAADANVSAALIVKHFGSKEALFDQVADFSEAAEMLLDAPDADSAGMPS